MSRVRSWVRVGKIVMPREHVAAFRVVPRATFPNPQTYGIQVKLRRHPDWLDVDPDLHYASHWAAIGSLERQLDDGDSGLEVIQ